MIPCGVDSYWPQKGAFFRAKPRLIQKESLLLISFPQPSGQEDRIDAADRVGHRAFLAVSLWTKFGLLDLFPCTTIRSSWTLVFSVLAKVTPATFKLYSPLFPSRDNIYSRVLGILVQGDSSFTRGVTEFDLALNSRDERAWNGPYNDLGFVNQLVPIINNRKTFRSWSV